MAGVYILKYLGRKIRAALHKLVAPAYTGRPMKEDRYGENYTNSLLPLLDANKLSEFLRLCASTTLSQEDLVDIILCAMSGKFDLNHRREIRNLLPDEMEIRRKDLEKIDPLEDPAKLMSRVSAIFDHPRKLIAHFFWTDDHMRWWLVLFTYKEMNRWRSGWSEGPHVHMVSHLTHPHASPNDFLEEILWAEKPKLPHRVHIRYQRIDHQYGAWPRQAAGDYAS